MFTMKVTNIKIYQGIYIEDIPVGGYTRDEAERVVLDYLRNLSYNLLTIKYETFTWNVNFSEIIICDIKKAVEKACIYELNDRFVSRLLTESKLRQGPQRIKIQIDLKKDAFNNLLKDIKDKVQLKAEDAYFYLESGHIKIQEDQQGVVIDEKILKEDIIEAFLKGKQEIYLKTHFINAHITLNELETLDIKEKIAEFTTYFNPKQYNRSQNIRLAAQSINGYILHVGKVFSFNEVVGERTPEKGYKTATIFIGDKAVPGIGGGVCQVSSTIYNVALLLGFDIIERQSHTLPVNYVPPGQDATVEYNQIDLKFRNTGNTPIVFFTLLENNKLTVVAYSSGISKL